jgi:hypothetical protein
VKAQKDGARQVKDAQRELKRSQRAYVQAQRDGARTIAQAQKAVTAAAKDLAKAQKDVTKATKAAGAKLKGFEKDLLRAFKGFGRAAEREFRPAMRVLARMATEAIKLAKNGLRPIGNASERVSKAMRNGFNNVIRVWKKQGVFKDLKAILKEIPGIMRNLMEAGGKAFGAVIKLLKIAMPRAKDLSKWLNKIAGNWLDWVKSHPERIEKFINKIKEWAPKLAKDIGTFVKEMFKLSNSKAMKNTWDFLLDTFKWLGNTGIPTVRRELKHMQPLIKSVGKAMGVIFSDKHDRKNRQRFAENIGQDWTQGVATGVKNEAKKKNHTKPLNEDTEKALRSFWVARSPSKRMAKGPKPGYEGWTARYSQGG